MKVGQRTLVGYRVKSSDGLYVHRTEKNGRSTLAALPAKSSAVSRADALRLMAAWLDCGYLPTLVHVFEQGEWDEAKSLRAEWAKEAAEGVLKLAPPDDADDVHTTLGAVSEWLQETYGVSKESS